MFADTPVSISPRLAMTRSKAALTVRFWRGADLSGFPESLANMDFMNGRASNDCPLMSIAWPSPAGTIVMMKLFSSLSQTCENFADFKPPVGRQYDVALQAEALSLDDEILNFPPGRIARHDR